MFLLNNIFRRILGYVIYLELWAPIYFSEHEKPVTTTEGPLSSTTQTTTAGTNTTESATSASTMSSEVVGTNLTTNLTAGAPTEATNLTEDASQNEIQQLNMTNYLDGKWMFSLVREFPLNIGVVPTRYRYITSIQQCSMLHN